MKISKLDGVTWQRHTTGYLEWVNVTVYIVYKRYMYIVYKLYLSRQTTETKISKLDSVTWQRRTTGYLEWVNVTVCIVYKRYMYIVYKLYLSKAGEKLVFEDGMCLMGQSRGRKIQLVRGAGRDFRMVRVGLMRRRGNEP